MPVIRKLVAVVFADVVGYSRLMERNEAGTHQRLRVPDFTISRLEAEQCSNNPTW